jgi:phage portal protein BeeE
MITAGLKRQQFEDRHLSNGLFPGLAVSFPRGMAKDQARVWLDFLEERHRGSGKAGKAIGVPDGASITALPLSLQDALFAEMTRLTMEQACAMYQVPLAILTPQRRPITDDDWRHFTSFAVAPVIQSMAEAFYADDDLFHPYDDSELSVQADMGGLLRLDPLMRAQVQHTQVQDGTRLVDELRAQDGYPDLPPVPEDWTQAPGKIPQITPVGGKPNPTMNGNGNGRVNGSGTNE